MTILLHVQPGASRVGVAGVHGERLKVRLDAPPVDGKANDALLRFLSDLLDIPRGRLSLTAGLTSRDKSVLAQGGGLEEVRRRIDAALGAV